MSKTQKRGKKRFWAVGFLLAAAMIFSGIINPDVYAAEGDKAEIINKTGVTSYATLDLALAAVVNGDTIRLLAPIEIAADGEIVVDKVDVDNNIVSFALDLGGQTITGTKDGPLIQVNAGAMMVYNGTITNLSKSEFAVAVGGPSISSVSYPVGYQPPTTIPATLEIPAAYHLNITSSENGTIRYGALDGTLTSLMKDALYAAGTTTHTFYFLPNEGYKVDSLKINGSTQTVSDQYTISNLTQNGTVEVGFNKITFLIEPLAYVNKVVPKLGLSVAPTPATVEYGGNQTFTYTVRNGFRLLDVTVNGISIGAVTTIELTNITSPQDVKIILEKTGLFIMLDAGHFTNYNHSPVLSSYYEGNTMWVYHQYLEQALEQYPNIIVDTTRANNSREIGEALLPSQRGAMGEGYDLVLSVHSNACSSSGPDHPVAIYTLNPNYTNISRTLGLKLATKVAEVMNTYEAPEVYGQLQSDGQDWYGINRGAASVGVASIILEHSFHTNYRSTVWLSSDGNLRALASAEAKVIADFYGMPAAQGVVTPVAAVVTPAQAAPVAVTPAPTGPSVSVVAGVRKATIRWNHVPGAYGYQIYRANGTSGKYYKVKTITRGGTLKWTNYGRAKGKVYTYMVRSYKKVNRTIVYGPFSSPVTVRIR